MSPTTALVVDDDRSLLALATRIVSDVGFDVIAAPSTENALEAVADVESLGLLFTDIVLPGRSGLELAATLRLARPELPVLVATGQWYGNVLDEATRAGYHLLRKPYDIATAQRAIHRSVTEPDPGPVVPR